MNSTFIAIISGLLTTFFLFAGSIKILGWQKMIFTRQLEFFELYGLNRKIMFLVGLLEVSNAILIWLPDYFSLIGALALFFTSAGAIFCHFFFDSWKNAIPAMLTLTLSGMVAFASYSLMSATL